MSDDRRGLRPSGGPLRSVDIEPPGIAPGKRSALTPGPGTPADPGKRAVTDGLEFDPVANLGVLARDIESAVDQINAAITSGQPEAALGARSVLARTLPWLRIAAEDPRPRQERRRAYLEAVEAITTPLLAQLPASTMSAAPRRRPGIFSSGEDVAATGVAGHGSTLPHLATIQASFGRHDVTGVRAHVDEPAREATRGLGALAYATGNDVAFRDANPELHTVAHEAAHVIQQRDGVAFKGAGGDPTLEAHADAVADAVVAGRSAERLLDAFAGRAAYGAVQRDDRNKPPSGAESRGTARVDEDTLPDSVQDFAIAPDRWSALVRTKWLAVDPKQRLFVVLQQMQRLGSFTWAKEEGLRRAADKTPALDATREVIRYVITLHTLAQMGLPPLSGAMVAREGDDLLIALKVPGVKGDDETESHPLRFDDSNIVYRAVEKFTNLTAKGYPPLKGFAVRDGIVEVQITDGQAAEMFGAKSWSDWKKTRGGAKDGGAAADKPADVSSELSFSEKMRVEGWLKANLNLVDSGPVTHIDRSTLNVIDEIEKNPDLKPILKQLIEKKTTAPGQIAGTFALEELLEAAKTERDRHRLGTDKLDQGVTKSLDPSEKVWDIDGRIVQKGLIFADRAMTFGLEFDWATWKAGRSADDTAKFADRKWHDELEWAVERLDKPGTPVIEKQSHDESSHIQLDHTFKLGEGEKSGQFKVHAFMRSTHFAPKHFTTVVEVKTEEARMAELRTQEFGDMLGPATRTVNYKFDIGTGQKVLGWAAGKDEDTHGSQTSGALPKDFKHTDPAERLKGRQDELELQKKLVAYLRKQNEEGKPGFTDAIQAAEQRVKFLEETETKLASDQSSGWKPFEVRGTYLSRKPDVPSGALDLYGFFKITRTVERPAARFEIMIRDLSNKIESDLEFTGDGESFDDALREAFVKLAKEYPDGKMSVLAEDLELVDGGFEVKPNGHSIGYELATTSAWKRVKSTIFDPVVQVLTNAAAMAIMIIFPPSATVIVPMLAVADIVNNVDDMVAKHDKGKLTFKSASIDLLQIGLDVLPAARGAKVLNPSKTVVQDAKMNMRLVLFDAVQLGGQFIVMYERTKEQLVEIQEKQIAVMADKYRALIELEKQVAEHKVNTSDPTLQQKRAEIEADAKSIRDTVTTTWTDAVQHQATFFVGSHLVGGHEAAAAGAKANKDTHFERPVPLEVMTLRNTAPNKFETEAQSLGVVHAHYEGGGYLASAIEYDHANAKAHFEITDRTTGTKTRVEARIGHVSSFAELQGARNQVVGHPIKKTGGLELIEKLNRGDATALKEVGITDAGDGKLPPDREFGLGELPNGDVVLVVGQRAAVDWAHLPGMKPRAHTHPASVNEIPLQDDGSHRVPLARLVEPRPDMYAPREVVFPSGADIILVAHQGVDGHVAVTEYVLRDGMVMKAPAGDHGPRLIFTIYNSHEIGSMLDGRKVYKAKVVGRSGTDTPVNHDVWVIAHPNGESGTLFMTQPAETILHEPGWTWESADTEATSGAATKTAAARRVPKTPLTPPEIKRKQALMKNWRDLGESELGELVKLRERTGETTYNPETPEHKQQAWKNTDSDKAFPKWSPVYHRNIKNSKTGLGREADLRERLDNGNGVVASRRVTTPRGDRQVDAAMPDRYFELKTGDEDLTRVPQGGKPSNLEAILRSRFLDKPVVWVIEGKASQPLRDMLNGIDPTDEKIEGPQGPKKKIELFEGEGAFEAAIAKYKLPPKKDGK